MPAGEPAADIQSGANIAVLDTNGIPSGLIIRRTDAFQVAMEFEILSPTVKALLGALSYEVKYFAESIGKGPEYDLGSVNRQTVAGETVYNQDKPAPPNQGARTQLEVPKLKLDPGVYRLGAMVVFWLACPNTRPKRYPMTAFTEGPVIEVYEP